MTGRPGAVATRDVSRAFEAVPPIGATAIENPSGPGATSSPTTGRIYECDRLSLSDMPNVILANAGRAIYETLGQENRVYRPEVTGALAGIKAVKYDGTTAFDGGSPDSRHRGPP